MTAFNFIGGAYTARSRNFEASRCVNLYPEASGSGSSKSIAMLIGTPGLRLWKTLPDTPIRGMIRINPNLAIVAAGAAFYSINAAGAFTLLGPMQSANSPVSMAYNGETVMVVTGFSGEGYFINILATTDDPPIPALTVTPIANEAFVGADKVDFIDEYFVFNKLDSEQIQITGQLSDTIDPLDFASAEGSPDQLISLIVSHEEIWLFGENSTEVWADSGDPNFPFARIQGAFIEQGCAAKNSVAKMANSVFWLAADDRGGGTVQKAVGYQPQRISNHALEFAIQNYPSIDDAVAYTYQQEGHYFYVLSFPSGNATWVYDDSTSLWHERAWRNPATGHLNRHRSICQMYFTNEIIVGDWQNGNLYVLDLDEYTDNGNILPAIRQCPHLATGNAWQFFHKLWIDMETGVGAASISQISNTPNITWADSQYTFDMADVFFDGTAPGTVTSIPISAAPKLICEWSDDGGHTFPQRLDASIGKIGERRVRMNYRRLGKSRDRVFRFTITDPVKRIFIGADLQVSTGS